MEETMDTSKGYEQAQIDKWVGNYTWLTRLQITN